MLSKFQLSGKQVVIVNNFKAISPVKESYAMVDERPTISKYENLLLLYLLEEVKKQYDVDWLVTYRIVNSKKFVIQARCFTGDADDAMTFAFPFHFKGLNIENFFDMETTIEHNDNIFTVKPVEIGEAVLQEV